MKPAFTMKRRFVLLLIVIAAVGIGLRFLVPSTPSMGRLAKEGSTGPLSGVIPVRFEYLSTHGNSNCSDSFRRSIASMPNDVRLQGSCCSPMGLHRYSEQLESIKKYRHIPEIPPDPYALEAGLAKRLMVFYDGILLTAEEQQAYDEAMKAADEKGPCCCQCWRWNTYGGLGKYLIRHYRLTGGQVAEVWDLSDGCGGDTKHYHT